MVTILNNNNSFVRFSPAAEIPYPTWGTVDFCLPVFEASDVNFQFVASGTKAEIDALFRPAVAEVSIALVSDCAGSPLISFAQKPTRNRLSDTQMLYNWEQGFPGFPGSILNGQCFKIRITFLIGVYDVPLSFCSNCFERITDKNYTSVLEFSNEDDAFGYKYCFAGDVAGGDSGSISCEPTIISFVNQSTLSVPYTAFLKDKYGDVPVVQTWIYDPNGVLTNMGIVETFNTYPPTVINFDFGGPATGIIILK